MNSWIFRGQNVLIVLVLLCTPFAFSQTITTGDVTGTVTDSSGAVVPGAIVTIKYLDTNETRTTAADETGRYRFTFLKPGRYEVSAVTSNMKSGTSEFTLLVGQEPAVDLVLKVQGTTEIVEVAAAGSVLQTENANQATSFNERQVTELPMNGGDITNMAFTVPGIRVNVGGGNANFNANGVPFNATLFTINGGDITEPYNNNNKSGASNNTLGANDISETAVILNAFSAQYGRMAGAQVNYVTKSGTNAFHGNLAESYNDAIFNANGFFNNATGTPQGRSVANQYAASVGGPIRKNKTFFFVNTEGLRYALPSSGVVSIPSPQLQQYILTHVPAASVPLYQDAFNLYNSAPGISRAISVTNGPGLLQDGVGNLGCGHQKFPGTYVNGSSGPRFGIDVPCAYAFGTNASSINTESLLSARVDHELTGKQRIFFRFSDDWGTQATSTSPINPVFNQQSVQPWYTGQMNHTYIISPAIVNNFVLSINYYSAVFGVPDFPKAQSLMPVQFAFSDGGANGTSPTGLTALGVPFPTGRRGGQFQAIDDLSWNRDKHTIQGGVNFRRNRVTDTSIASGSQIGTYTIADLTDFAIGLVNSTNTGSKYTQSFPLLQAAHIRLYSLNFYVQDQWNLNKNLRLTYGIRFERNEDPACTDNCFSRFNGTFGTSGGVAVPYNSSITTGLSRAFPHIETLIPAPRVGIVYTPFGQNKTVLRAGFGLFANTFPGNLAASVFGNSPAKFSPTVAFGTIGLPGTPGTAQAAAVASDQVFQTGFSQGFTLAQFQSALGKVPFGVPAYYIPPNTFKTPKVVEWSFEIEQPLNSRNVLAINYSGNHGYNESILNQDANAFIGTVSRYPNGFGGLPTVPPDSRFSTVTELLTTGYSNYDGLSVQVRHAFSLGFQGQAGYTWSHALQTGAVFNTSSGASTIAEYNPYNLRANYGATNFDTRHNLSADIVWNPPKFGNKLMESVLGGWTLGGKLYLYSGRPFSVINSQVPGLLSTTFGGSVLADLLTPGLLGTYCTAVNSRCLTPSEFATSQTQKDFGNIPPNSFRGPGYFDIDSEITKKIPVTERMFFQIGASAYNLLNHPNFANPNNNVASGSFGSITSTISAPTSIYGSGQGALVSGRVLVVAGKFNF